MSARHVNHRGWIVLESVAAADGSFCVDFFEHPGGEFGFEHFRSDPEDGGRWTAIGGFSASTYPSTVEAVDAATQAVFWLRQPGPARSMCDAWRSSQVS